MFNLKLFDVEWSFGSQLPEEGQKWGFLIWLVFSYCGLVCIACISAGKVSNYNFMDPCIYVVLSKDRDNVQSIFYDR